VDREPKIKEADLLVKVVKRVLKPKLNLNPSSLKRRELKKVGLLLKLKLITRKSLSLLQEEKAKKHQNLKLMI